MNRSIPAAILLLAFLSAAASGQHGSTPPAAPAPQNPIEKPAPAAAAPAPADAPAADSSAGAASRFSIVTYDDHGRLVRTETRPEEAAARKLKLNAEERRVVNELLYDRVLQFDVIVFDNLEVLLSLLNARQTGDNAAASKAMADIQAAFQPLTEKGTLDEQLCDVLPRDKAEQLVGIVRDYWRAVYADAVKSGAVPAGPVDAKGHSTATKAGMKEFFSREMLIVFGMEVQRSYERISDNLYPRFQSLVKDLSLPPEQDAKLASLFAGFAEATKQSPTMNQKSELFRMILAELTPEQLAKFKVEVRKSDGPWKFKESDKSKTRPEVTTRPTGG